MTAGDDDVRRRAAPRRRRAAPTPSATAASAAARARSVPRAGWMVVAGKEFADHLLSVRFVVLLLDPRRLAAAIPLYLAAEQIRTAALEATTAGPALFLALFRFAPSVPTPVHAPASSAFIALVAPLLGLAFAFDAVNGERAAGTLPRLLSQPIHRDDVINGKFAAGLAVIGLVLVVDRRASIAALGIFRLGIVPSAQELLRIVIWLLVTFLYVSLWLAFGHAAVGR